MPPDDRDELAEDAERRENALRFIRHPSAFVYSIEYYAALRALTHGGLTDPPEARGFRATAG